MVHFGEKLRTNVVRRWADHYIDYKRLKAAIKRKMQQLQDHPEYERGVMDAQVQKYIASLREESSMAEPLLGAEKRATPLLRTRLGRSLRRLVARDPDAEFTALVLEELKKVDDFYLRKCEEYSRRLEILCQQLDKHGVDVRSMGITVAEATGDSDGEDGVSTPVRGESRHTVASSVTDGAAELPMHRVPRTQASGSLDVRGPVSGLEQASLRGRAAGGRQPGRLPQRYRRLDESFLAGRRVDADADLEVGIVSPSDSLPTPLGSPAPSHTSLTPSLLFGRLPSTDSLCTDVDLTQPVPGAAMASPLIPRVQPRVAGAGAGAGTGTGAAMMVEGDEGEGVEGGALEEEDDAAYDRRLSSASTRSVAGSPPNHRSLAAVAPVESTPLLPRSGARSAVAAAAAATAEPAGGRSGYGASGSGASATHTDGGAITSASSSELASLVASSESKEPRAEAPPPNPSASRPKVPGAEELQQVQLSSHSLKRAFVDAYRSMQLLQNFAILNYTGFVKILKKHDKCTGIPLGREILPILHARPFYNAERLKNLISLLETTYSEAFCDRNLNIARAELLVKQKQETNWREFHFGLRLGLVLMLLFWMAWDSMVDAHLRPASNHASEWIKSVLPVYRCIGCLILMVWCWGANLYCWSLARINYLYIFELDPVRTMDYQAVFQKAGVLSALFLADLLLFFKTVRDELFFDGSHYVGFYPLVLFLLVWGHFFVPWRGEIMRGLKQVIISPFGLVTFFTAYQGDVLTSLAKVNQDLGYSICFFATGDFMNRDGATTCNDGFYFKRLATPLLIALPLWFRFLQNLNRYHKTGKRFPFVANAFKYAFAHSVVLFGVFHPSFKSTTTHVGLYQSLWILSLALSTMYTFSWDVLMDWGLGYRKHGYLRERLMFKRKWIYYVAIVLDFFLRFLWTLTLLPSRAGILSLAQYLDPILAAAEILRRCMWGMFRVENEHLFNTEGYRRVDFVPLHFESPLRQATGHRKTGGSIVTEILLMTGVVVSLGILAVVSQ